MTPEAMPQAEEASSKPTSKPDEKPKWEISVCGYENGKLALKVDDGEKVPVSDLDTAMTAIRRFVESETEDAGRQPGEMAEQASEGGEEQDFQAGFAGPQGPGY